jgi:hypothetical protein
MSESVGLSRFVLIRAEILYSVFSQVICPHSDGVVGMSVFRYAHQLAAYLYFYEPNIQVHLIEYGQNVILDVLAVNV